MNAETIAIVAAVIACYLSACSNFEARAVVNPITGSAQLSIKAAK